MTTEIDLADHIHQLKLLLKTAKDPKLLWEEMQILGKKAFNLQVKIEEELDEVAVYNGIKSFYNLKK